jgi:hypothetical protein
VPPDIRPDLRAGGTDINDPGRPGALDVPVPLDAHRRRAWLILAAAVWTAYVWLTRLGIVLDGAQTTGFRIVHAVLIVVSLAFAAILGRIGWRMRNEARRAAAPRSTTSRSDRPGEGR